MYFSSGIILREIRANFCCQCHGLWIIQDTAGKGSGRFRAKIEAEPTPFHPGVAVRAVAWCPNMGRSHLLASGTGIGTVRIDRLEPGSVKVSEGYVTAQELKQRKDRAMTIPADGDGSPEPLTVDNWDPEERIVSFVKMDVDIVADARADGAREEALHKADFGEPTEPGLKKFYPKAVKTPAPPGEPKKRGRPRKPRPEEEDPKPPKEKKQAAPLKEATDGVTGEKVPKRIGRPPKPKPEKVPKKRGRPPKQKPQEATASQTVELSGPSALAGGQGGEPSVNRPSSVGDETPLTTLKPPVQSQGRGGVEAQATRTVAAQDALNSSSLTEMTDSES